MYTEESELTSADHPFDNVHLYHKPLVYFTYQTIVTKKSHSGNRNYYIRSSSETNQGFNFVCQLHTNLFIVAD